MQDLTLFSDSSFADGAAVAQFGIVEAEVNYHRQLAETIETQIETLTNWPPRNPGRFNELHQQDFRQ